MPEPRDDDTTLARIAGTIAAGLVNHPDMADAAHGLLPDRLARVAVDLARLIVARVRDTDVKP